MNNDDVINSDQINIDLDDHNEAIKSIMEHIEEIDNETFYNALEDYNSYGFENYLNEKMDEYKGLMNIDSRYESIIDNKFIKNIDYDAIKKIYKEYNDVDYYKQYNTYKQFMNIDPKYSYYLGNVARFLPRINYKKGSEYFKNRFSELTNNLKLPKFSKDNQKDEDWRKGDDYEIKVI